MNDNVSTDSESENSESTLRLLPPYSRQINSKTLHIPPEGIATEYAFESQSTSSKYSLDDNQKSKGSDDSLFHNVCLRTIFLTIAHHRFDAFIS